MTRKVGRATAVGEPGSVVDVRPREEAALQCGVEAGAERVALIVVQQEVPAAWRKVRQAAADRPAPFGLLSCIRQVDMSTLPRPRRADGQLPSPDELPLNRQREKDVRIAD